MGFDGVRDDVFAEIGVRVVEQFAKDVAVEDVNAHRGQELFVPAFDPQLGVPLDRQPQRILHRRILGLLDKPRDAPVLGDLHDPQRLRFRPANRDGGDGHIGPRLLVFGDHAAEIHAKQLIAAEDHQILKVVIEKVDEVFADGVGGAFIPGRVGKCLLGGEHLHEAAGEMIELVGLRQVAMQGRGVELRQNVDAPEAGVDARGNRHIHEAVLACQGHGGLGAILGEGKQPRALAAAHDHAQDRARVQLLTADAAGLRAWC